MTPSNTSLLDPIVSYKERKNVFLQLPQVLMLFIENNKNVLFLHRTFYSPFSLRWGFDFGPNDKIPNDKIQEGIILNLTESI
jgi:hypothetical protein